MELTNQIIQLKMQLKDLILQEWLTQEIFSLKWWFLLAYIVLGYIVWIKLLDKRRVMEIVLFGSFIAVMNVCINIVAELYGLWTFEVRLLPIMPAVFPFDLSFIPVIFMLAYQYFTPWKKYFWGAALGVALYSFIFVPILKYWDILELQNWKTIYTFILRYAQTIIAKLAIDFIKNIQTRANAKTS